MGPRIREALGEAGPWLVPGYYGWLALGATLAMLAAGAALRRRRDVAHRRALAALAVAFACGLLGAVLFPGLVALAQGRDFLAHGLVAYGGFAGGVVGAVGACRLLRVDPVAVADAAAPSVGIGVAFTRVGCFVAGCDFGGPSALPWAVEYPSDSQAFRQHLRAGLVQPFELHSLPVHPAPLYEALLGLAIFFFWSRAPARGRGTVALGVAASYAAGRTLIELARGDLSRGAVLGLSTSQWISAAVLLACALALSWSRAGRRWSASRTSASSAR
jgi:prolipoprotein diacylglyceryltransferase